ncbi:hypothetical protein LINGRAHAP2_LOCUS24838, partial [Linum grandiflorum]
RLGDDLWLLNCSSSAEVDQILNLQIWKLESFRILADRWIPNSGRSNVLSIDRCSWIRIYGILIHLRSMELLKQIGKACGIMLEVDLRDWFADEIRIKIEVGEELPDEIKVVYEDWCFPVEVIVEPSPAVAFRLPSVDMSQGDASGNNFCFPISLADHAATNSEAAEASGKSMDNSTLKKGSVQIVNWCLIRKLKIQNTK